MLVNRTEKEDTKILYSQQELFEDAAQGIYIINRDAASGQFEDCFCWYLIVINDGIDDSVNTVLIFDEEINALEPMSNEECYVWGLHVEIFEKVQKTLLIQVV